MNQKTTAHLYRLVAVNPEGERFLVDEYRTGEEAFAELKLHLAELENLSRNEGPAGNLRDWYGPNSGRRLVVTGPDHNILPRTVDTTRGI